MNSDTLKIYAVFRLGLLSKRKQKRKLQHSFSHKLKNRWSILPSSFSALEPFDFRQILVFILCMTVPQEKRKENEKNTR